MAIDADHVKTIGPAGISVIDFVVLTIKDCGQIELESLQALIGCLLARLEVVGLLDFQQLFLAVGDGEQDRIGMSFANVDENEFRVWLVGLI